MRTLKLTGVSDIPRQKKEEFLNPDKIFFLYTGISWVLKFFLNIFPGPHFLDKPIRVEITFLISIFLTFNFIIYCYIRKVDWYGKKKNAFVSSVKKWTEKKWWTNLLFLPFLFIFDPFLFFIYFRNGSKKIPWQILTWLLLSLSLLLNSIILMNLGNLFQSFF